MECSQCWPPIIFKNYRGLQIHAGKCHSKDPDKMRCSLCGGTFAKDEQHGCPSDQEDEGEEDEEEDEEEEEEEGESKREM